MSTDFTTRWLAHWDAFSADIPEGMSEAGYANIALGAWLAFKRQDDESEIAALSRAWGIKQYAKLKPRLAPRAKQPQATVILPKRWEPCAYWRGEPCTVHSHAPDESQRVRAGEMWHGYMDFVRKRIHAEILPWTGGKSYPKFDDLEQETWWLIARQIKQYAPEPETGKPFAWLRTVVHSAVVDHFRSEYSQKRDVRKEVPTDFDKDRGIANPTDPMLPPQSVHPQGAEPYGSGDPDGEEAKTRWTECAGFLSSD